MTAEPNFILAGAPRAGTTSLFHYLDQHPQVYLSPIKEPTYFAAAELARPEFSAMGEEIEQNRVRARAFLDGPMDGRLAQGLVLEWENYLRLFRNVTTETAIGEASVTYFWAPSAPAAIRARLPGARLLFMLRDPAERLFSHYLWTLPSSPGTSFRARFEEAVQGKGSWRPVLEAGRYGTNLARFFAEFPGPQIRAWLHEDFRADPAAVMRDIFGFLGVRQDYAVDMRRVHNQSVVPRFTWLHSVRRRVLGGTAIMRNLPGPLQGLARRLYHRPRGELRMAPADRRMVQEYFQEEMRQAADLLGRDLSPWTR